MFKDRTKYASPNLRVLLVNQIWNATIEPKVTLDEVSSTIRSSQVDSVNITTLRIGATCIIKLLVSKFSNTTAKIIPVSYPSDIITHLQSVSSSDIRVRKTLDLRNRIITFQLLLER